MTDLLLRLFAVKKAEPIDADARTRVGVLGGVAGLLLNLLLAAGKFAAGSLSHSLAVTADAMNNLTDAGSALISAVGAKLAGKGADAEHPFGHGRMEYLVTVFFAVLVCVMGLETGKSALERVFNPEPVTFRWAAAAIVVGSILCKLWLGLFYRKLGGLTKAPALLAASSDSFSDTLCGGVTLLSLAISRFTAFPADGYLGAAVALFILWNGLKLLLETLNLLMGERPTGELAGQITAVLRACKGIVGVHDMMLHDYGPGRVFGSAHAEVPADVDVMVSHEAVDAAEKLIYERFAVPFVLHMDPIQVNDARVRGIYDAVKDVIKSVDGRLTLHDFRVVDGEKRVNLIFDLVMPHGSKSAECAELERRVREGISALDARYQCVMRAEYSYV
ncbi:MAG: cation diffusion facilitator family transporter [Oscillospiraceae bacterium]|jgi:cation diffusion facilitator family transporter|nr:cation diffusion facilitator family transporter [Oscillospiraceae bacterium]